MAESARFWRAQSSTSTAKMARMRPVLFTRGGGVLPQLDLSVILHSYQVLVKSETRSTTLVVGVVFVISLLLLLSQLQRKASQLLQNGKFILASLIWQMFCRCYVELFHVFSLLRMSILQRKTKLGCWWWPSLFQDPIATNPEVQRVVVSSEKTILVGGNSLRRIAMYWRHHNTRIPLARNTLLEGASALLRRKHCDNSRQQHR